MSKRTNLFYLVCHKRHGSVNFRATRSTTSTGPFDRITQIKRAENAAHQIFIRFEAHVKCDVVDFLKRTTAIWHLPRNRQLFDRHKSVSTGRDRVEYQLKCDNIEQIHKLPPLSGQLLSIAKLMYILCNTILLIRLYDSNE